MDPLKFAFQFALFMITQGRLFKVMLLDSLSSETPLVSIQRECFLLSCLQDCRFSRVYVLDGRALKAMC